MNGIRMAVALGIGVQLSCMSPQPPAASVLRNPDTARVELMPPVTDLSGDWATGSAYEPPSGPVVLHPSCANNPAVWIIQQEGNTLKAWALPASFNQGIKREGPGPERIAASPGTMSGADVLIAEEGVRYVLRYDAESGHLRGTRNGVPFWAARQVIARGEICLGIP
jgi:hypothetical protein